LGKKGGVGWLMYFSYLTRTFGHANICKFTRADGSPVRPWTDPAEMDEAMVQNWNSVVGEKDVVYHLGDVVMNRRFLPIMARLNGRKKLILGNHDIFDHKDYAQYFERLHGSFKFEDLMLSHIPLHHDSVASWARCNVHGHIHEKDIDDSRYFNVSVENIEYTPVSLEDLRIKINEKQSCYSVDKNSNDVSVHSNDIGANI